MNSIHALCPECGLIFTPELHDEKITLLESKLAKAREAFSEIMVVHTFYEPASMIARATLKEIE